MKTLLLLLSYAALVAGPGNRTLVLEGYGPSEILTSRPHNYKIITQARLLDKCGIIKKVEKSVKGMWLESRSWKEEMLSR